ncbi:MAG: Rieske (2Fe-2S) protein, partial [Planctomycetia bacterium]|nr:Rieske (2Fe-2S) protein [Planctomycetia bacterium]
PEPVAPAAPPADGPTAASLGRPLTLKEKLAAARAGGSAPAPAQAAPKPAAATEAVASADESAAGSVKSVPAPAASLGRPMTLAEKLAAARSGGSAPAPAAGGAATPAAAKATPAAAAAKPAAARRELPPLDKITDTRDLAEALRQAGEKKAREADAAKAKTGPAPKPAKEKESKPQSVLPRPTRESVGAAAAYTRRALFSVTGLIWVGWAAFTLGCVQFTAMMGRFMFPNVLAEPPSTIKVGPPSNYEPEAVNERFKAEWGFWIVRSTRYNGTDIIYAVQSVCTHLGCPPNWLAGEQKFKCPCHGSGFYISGINFEGPAPRPLERFKVTTADDGQLVVDKSQKFQEELGQWSDPDSYIQA